MDFKRDMHCILGNVESFGVSAKNLQVSLHNSKVLKYTSQQNVFWDWAILVNFSKFCNFEEVCEENFPVGYATCSTLLN